MLVSQEINQHAVLQIHAEASQPQGAFVPLEQSGGDRFVQLFSEGLADTHSVHAGEILVRYAASHAQAQHQALEPGILLGDPLRRRFVACQVRIKLGWVHCAALAEEAVGRGAEAEVRHAGPAAEVVPAGVAFAGEIADFVLMKAMLRERLPGKLVHVAFHVLVWKSQLSGRDIAADRRFFLDDQTVTGEMRGREGHGGRQRFPKVEDGLRRQAEHQVEVDIVESRLAGDVYGGDHFLPIMDPAEEPQETGLACLRTQGQAVDACLAQGLGKGSSEGSGVAFAGDLGVRFNGESLIQSIQDMCYLEFIEKRGCAPAQEDGVRCRVPRLGAAAGYFPDHGLYIGWDIRLAPGVRGEVAVGALVHAEGDVDVETDGWVGRSVQVSHQSRQCARLPS